MLEISEHCPDFLERYINCNVFEFLSRRILTGKELDIRTWVSTPRIIGYSRKPASERTSRFEVTLLGKAWAKDKNENPGVGVIIMEIKELKFKVIVKTNSGKNEIVSYDKIKKAYRINLNAKPIEGEANKELIKFLSKELKKNMRIVSGFRSKEKIIELL